MKKIEDIIYYEIKKNKIKIIYVNQNKIRGNAITIKLENNYYIFINKDIPKELFILVFFHEISHIETGNLKNKIVYNRYIETKMNILAIFKLKSFFKLNIVMYMLVLAVISEKKLYIYFKNKNKILIEEIKND